MLSLIVATSRNLIIGRNGGLPWRLRSDLQRFKKLTMGHTLIMGRKTYESIGRVLPGRRTIVISRTIASTEGGEVAASIHDALAMARDDAEPFVIGGGEIYRLALPLANRLYVTRVEADIDGDTYLPTIDFAHFTRTLCERIDSGPGDEFPCTFEVWQRSSWEGNPADRHF